MSVVNFLVALIAMYLLWVLTVKRALRDLTCQRSFSCKTAYEGEEAELVEVVRNDGPFIIPWLRVESYISPNLRLGKQDNLLVSHEAFYRSCFTLMPYQQIRRRHRVKFLHRGVYNLGNATLSAGDILGLTRHWKEQQLQTPVTVYPQILEREDLPYPMVQVMGEVESRNRMMQDPFLVKNIRPYRFGDRIRDIHWQATARTDEVQVRVHDDTICPKLLVVLNAQRTDEQWDDYVRKDDVEQVEKEIRYAATICVRSLLSGLSVGFAANMPQERNGQSTLLLPDSGEVSQEDILEIFARLQVHCSEKFIPFLESLDHCRDLDIMILSPYDSDGIQQAIGKLRACGNRVTFCSTKGGDL